MICPSTMGRKNQFNLDLLVVFAYNPLGSRLISMTWPSTLGRASHFNRFFCCLLHTICLEGDGCRWHCHPPWGKQVTSIDFLVALAHNTIGNRMMSMTLPSTTGCQFIRFSCHIYVRSTWKQIDVDDTTIHHGTSKLLQKIFLHTIGMKAEWCQWHGYNHGSSKTVQREARGLFVIGYARSRRMQTKVTHWPPTTRVKQVISDAASHLPDGEWWPSHPRSQLVTVIEQCSGRHKIDASVFRHDQGHHPQKLYKSSPIS